MEELVLVVHGVGDPAPGETLSLLARSTCDPQQPLRESSETLWLHEDSPTCRFEATFPCPIRTHESEGRTTVFAEVFWGDLSQVRRGLFGVLRGLIEILFGLRYVAFVAADQPGRWVRRLQWLGQVAYRVLSGPMLAINLVLASVIVTMAMSEVLWHGSSALIGWSWLIVFGNGLFLASIAAVQWRSASHRVPERFWFWVLVTTGFLGVLLLAAPLMVWRSSREWAEEFALIWYARVLIQTMSLVWLALMGLTSAMGVCWLFAQRASRASRRGLDAALLLPLMSIGGWGQLLPLFWLIGEHVLSRLFQIPKSTNLFYEAAPLLGIQCVMCLMLGGAQLAVLIHYATWRPRNSVATYRLGKAAPRLIVHLTVQAIAALCAVIGVTLVFILGINGVTAAGPRRQWLLDLIETANLHALLLLPALAGLLLVALRHLSSALDIILDVVNHFYFRRRDEATGRWTFEDEFAPIQGSFESGELVFSRREAIHQRLSKLLVYLAGETDGRRPDLTIVAHSQGTMIAIEALNDPQLGWLRQSFSKIRLVTMGSPFTHIYQHYFNRHYPPLDQPAWSMLRQNVDRWSNIFRIDDYVGTAIDFPESLSACGGPSCENLPIERFGHNLYWSDKEVISLLRDHVGLQWLQRPAANEADESPAAVPLRRAG